MNPSPGQPIGEQHGGAAAIDLRSMGTFLRQWVRDPVKMASVTPSGHQLAQLMVAQLPAGSSRVVEIGAGTGVFTRALLDAGVAPSRLLVIEINPHLADFLRARFPGVTIACADARRLGALCEDSALLRGGGVDAVVSGLGMLSMASEQRTAILHAAFGVLGKGGRFIQFTYGPASPVRRGERSQLAVRVRRAGFALWNLPPATVYVYERLHSHEIACVRPPPRG
ncbi:MAG: class I SAM-dependent methyltransferase [Rhodanobacteraceae bacterium]